jgi:DNA helicase II / ATP-dependent DNA helicase PcrA
MKYLEELNPEQREAVEVPDGPLLVIAGAGSGKTRTLAYRVAHLVRQGVAPETILLLTFTRRAAEEMLRRAQGAVGKSSGGEKISGQFGRIWGGTFHAMSNRLLRTYAKAIGMSPEFTVLDEGDSQNLMNVARRNLGLNAKKERFPQKGTLLAIYSRTVNTGRGPAALAETIKSYFPWVAMQLDDVRELFRQYVQLKHERNLLDYDDLLLFWLELLKDEKVADLIEARFSHILVDEYQDTNPLQADILKGMRRHNKNIMVVGDDAQAIYAFRAATVRNILDFPNHFPGCRVVTLTQNYRSVQPILEATNRVIAYARERYTKDLWSDRKSDQKPYLVTCFDEREQTDYVIDEILKHFEEGVPLRHQAVLFRAGQLSADLEIELVRRNIPYHKYGGLRYLEAAHVKDLLSFLRVLENSRDDLAWHRILNLLPGIGEGTATDIYEQFAGSGFSYAHLAAIEVPPRAREKYAELAALLGDLGGRKHTPVAEEVRRVRQFYTTLLPDLYENAEVRDRDLDHLELVAQGYKSRRQFLTDLALDPPSSTSDLAGPPTRDEDWLVLSTMHSAKGLEFDVVYVIHAADGFIPSDLSTGSVEETEEERRLLYVAMTRARNLLHVTFPLRYYSKPYGYSDRHGYAQLTRFIPPELFQCFERVALSNKVIDEDVETSQNLSRRVRGDWWEPT